LLFDGPDVTNVLSILLVLPFGTLRTWVLCCMSKILVIDDEAWLREMIQLALQQRGFEVIEASDSDEGIAAAREKLPDLILCDVNMAKAGAGYTTLAKLREEPTTASIPFILMTGLADAAGMRHGMALGADDYLPKPFKIDELYAAVDARLRKVRTVREEVERKFSNLRNQITMMLPHEMRTPLNGIISNAELLASAVEMPLPPSEIAEMGREISESGQRLERLIENFLVYAQLQIVAADPATVSALRDANAGDPGEIVRAIAISQADRTGRLADLVVQASGSPPAIAAEYFKRIIAELVQNAFKFSPGGTNVRVSCKMAGGMVEFSVQDFGRGFSTEQIQRIGAYVQFERKMQDVEGLGLGLAIARKLVELHGGSLTIDSGQGTGATVTVTLPAAKIN
jgi:two-component system sensor histidine kinase/response regulator